jgi:hypothetical protein
VNDLRIKHLGAVALICRIFGDGHGQADENHDAMEGLARHFNELGYDVEMLKNGAKWALFDRKEASDAD